MEDGSKINTILKLLASQRDKILAVRKSTLVALEMNFIRILKDKNSPLYAPIICLFIKYF